MIPTGPTQTNKAAVEKRILEERFPQTSACWLPLFHVVVLHVPLCLCLHVNQPLRHICGCLFSCLLTATSSQTVQHGIDSEYPFDLPMFPLWTLALCLFFPPWVRGVSPFQHIDIWSHCPCFPSLAVALCFYAFVCCRTLCTCVIDCACVSLRHIVVLTGSVGESKCVAMLGCLMRRLTTQWH